MAWEQPSGKQSGDGDQWENIPGLGPLFEQFKQQFNKFGNSGAYIAGIAVIVLIWALFGIYQLDEQEKAVVLRFGKFNEVVGPGLHWNPPLIDQINKINVTKVYSVSYNGQMLTRDENIVKIRITAQYRVINPVDYVLEVREPILSLRHAMESALRHVVGGTEIDEVITFGREKVAIEVKERLQSYISLYRNGIRIEQLNINEADPPQEVKAAFDDVNKALEDEARFKNEAEAYANEVVPKARGQARRVEEEAAAYKEDVIARATGEADRFTQLLKAYSKAPQVTRERLYIEAVESVLGDVSKVIVDLEQGNSLFYLPLDKLSGNPATLDSDSSRLPPVDPEVIRNLSERVRREASRVSRQRQ